MFRQVSTAALMALAALTTCGAGVSHAHAAETAAPQKPKEAGGNNPIAVNLGGGVKLKLTLIPAGEFKMGSGESAEATAAFFNLPTEAEWEYACRAGTTTRYFSGDDPETLAKVGNVADATAKAQFPGWAWTLKASDGYVFTSPVGSFQPNAFGLYDMHGNAWQWCADWYEAEYYAKSPADDPNGPDSGDSRVLRGGSWSDWPGSTRSAKRGSSSPVARINFTGFRVSRTQ